MNFTLFTFAFVESILQNTGAVEQVVVKVMLEYRPKFPTHLHHFPQKV